MNSSFQIHSSLIGSTVIGYKFGTVKFKLPQKIVAMAMEHSDLMVFLHCETDGIVTKHSFQGCILQLKENPIKNS
jgi:hypothetical protein